MWISSFTTSTNRCSNPARNKPVDSWETFSSSITDFMIRSVEYRRLSFHGFELSHCSCNKNSSSSTYLWRINKAVCMQNLHQICRSMIKNHGKDNLTAVWKRLPLVNGMTRIVCSEVPSIANLNPFCDIYWYIEQRRGSRGESDNLLQCWTTWERESERRLSRHT